MFFCFADSPIPFCSFFSPFLFFFFVSKDSRVMLFEDIEKKEVVNSGRDCY